MDPDGDNANASETKVAQESSVSSTNVNADVKSAIKSDEIPPLIEGTSSSSSSSSSESDREEMERVPRHLNSRFQRLTSEANGIKNEQLKAYLVDHEHRRRAS